MLRAGCELQVVSVEEAECQQALPQSRPPQYDGVAPCAAALPAAVVRAAPLPPGVAEPGQQPGIDWLSETSGTVPAERVRPCPTTVGQNIAGIEVGASPPWTSCVCFWTKCCVCRPALPQSCAATSVQCCERCAVHFYSHRNTPACPKHLSLLVLAADGDAAGEPGGSGRRSGGGHRAARDLPLGRHWLLGVAGGQPPTMQIELLERLPLLTFLLFLVGSPPPVVYLRDFFLSALQLSSKAA